MCRLVASSLLVTGDLFSMLGFTCVVLSGAKPVLCQCEARLILSSGSPVGSFDRKVPVKLLVENSSDLSSGVLGDLGDTMVLVSCESVASELNDEDLPVSIESENKLCSR
jgi:hypothetical protein